MDHAIIIERHIPCPEHVDGNLVAFLTAVSFGNIGFQLGSINPAHGQEPVGGEFFKRFRHIGPRLISQHRPIEPHVRRLPPIIQFFLKPLGQLGVNIAGGDRVIIAFIERENQFQLAQVSLNRRPHIRVLELAGIFPAIMPRGPMHLTE